MKTAQLEMAKKLERKIKILRGLRIGDSIVISGPAPLKERTGVILDLQELRRPGDRVLLVSIGGERKSYRLGDLELFDDNPSLKV